MKSKRKKLIAVILAVLFVALVLNAIFTWGICFQHNGGFDDSDTNIFEDSFTEKQTGRIALGNNYTEFPICIPLVFYVYRIDPPPYVIRLSIDDETVSFEKLFIELVSVEYVNGPKIEHKINWGIKFDNFPIYRTVESKLIEIPAMRLECELPITVDKRQSCRIRLVGYFLNKEGNKMPFDTTKYFEYEPYKWSIYPLAGSF